MLSCHRKREEVTQGGTATPQRSTEATKKGEYEMRYWTNSAINRERSEADRLYKTLAHYAPDEKLSRDDVGQLLFVLRHYDAELESILADREKAERLSKK